MKTKEDIIKDLQKRLINAKDDNLRRAFELKIKALQENKEILK
ncbi:hypothetical protein [Tenacibaculum phage JQ]|nr:hypothetical protein [Tenacibaculum phage JQ]